VKIHEVRKIVKKLIETFDLPKCSVTELPNTVRHFGECYDTKRIKIRLKYYKKNRDLSRNTIIDTICHELSHLAHFDHGRDFKRLYNIILSYTLANF